MTKKYKTLQKKLQELEAELHFIYSLPPEIAQSHDHRPLVAAEIQQHFVFLNKLVSAEIKSNASNPRHLHHIAQKLNDLETIFRNWESASAGSAPVGSFNSAPISSSDDDEKSGDRSELLAELGSSDFGLIRVGGEDKKGTEVEAKGALMEKKKKKGRFFVQFWRFCGVFVSGVIFGTALIGMSMMEFSCSSISSGFPFPT